MHLVDEPQKRCADRCYLLALARAEDGFQDHVERDPLECGKDLARVEGEPIADKWWHQELSLPVMLLAIEDDYRPRPKEEAERGACFPSAEGLRGHHRLDQRGMRDEHPLGQPAEQRFPPEERVVERVDIAVVAEVRRERPLRVARPEKDLKQAWGPGARGERHTNPESASRAAEHRPVALPPRSVGPEQRPGAPAATKTAHIR